MKTVLSLIETAGPGGAETVFVELLKGLDRSRWRGIAVIPNTGWLHDRLVENGTEVHVVPESRSLDVRFFARVAAIARKERAQVIHGHLFGSSLRAVMLGALSGARSVGTLHGMPDLISAERYRALKVGMLRWRLDRLVFVSESLRQSFLAVVPFPSDRVRVISNGLDASKFDVPRDPAFRRALGLSETDFLVGAVGNLNVAKGFDVLLRAAALLKTREPGYRFVIIGDAQGRQSAELLALRTRLGLDRDVVFTGFRSDIPIALAALDVYVLTSRSEGFAISLVEAMAAGRPVIATRCGGPENIVRNGESGLLVANGSAEEVAAAIERVRRDPERSARMAAAGRVVARTQFTIAAQIAAYQCVYDEIADGTHHGR